MAAEAVLKIKETEEKGKELIRKANDDARKILAQAKADGESRKREILDEAAKQRTAMIQAAVDKANTRCESIVSEGAAQRDKLLSPDSARLDSAIKLVMERIVSTDGNR